MADYTYQFPYNSHNICVSEGHEAVTAYDFIKDAKDICVSSLQAGKDYVAAQVKKKLASYIRTCLNSAIEPDTLTKDNSASEYCKSKSKTATEKNKSGPFRSSAISAYAKKVKKIAKILAKKLKAPKHNQKSKKTASLKSKSAPKNAYTTKK